MIKSSRLPKKQLVGSGKPTICIVENSRANSGDYGFIYDVIIDNISMKVSINLVWHPRCLNGPRHTLGYRLVFDNPNVKKHPLYKQIRKDILSTSGLSTR